MEIFYPATTITLGNGQKLPLWHAPWLEGNMPKDIAPKIFGLCKRKKWTLAHALHDNEWIRKLSTDDTLSIEHLTNLCNFWRSSKMFTSMRIWRTTFIGSSQAMANTLRHPHTICNYSALLNQASTRLFGRLGRLQKRSTMLGLLYKKALDGG
jgi:hypothetical protein